MTVLVLVEHDRGSLATATLEALTAARSLDSDVHALTIGAAADGLDEVLAGHGAAVVHQAHHEALTDYAPEAWGDVLAQCIIATGATAVVATGTDIGNEVMAHAAATLDLPMAANCLDAVAGQPMAITRVRWGGSLLEQATLDAPVALLTFAHHHVEPVALAAAGEARPFTPVLTDTSTRTRVVDRVERAAGVTLGTAQVVVGGGRGVGSADGFAPLEALAALLGGVVGCSRAVTNNGWRNHTDQVGQTGTRIAPDIYIACGISGAIQHWVGAMASKKILAINTDPQANMVTKADYAVIGDLHEVVPAISAEIARRRA